MPLFSPFFETFPGPGTHRRKVNGGQNQYLLRVPPHHDPSYPATLVMLTGDKPGDILKKAGWEGYADRMGFLAVATDTKDGATLRAVYDDLNRLTRLNPNRLYIAGRDTASACRALPGVGAVAGECGGTPAGVSTLALPPRPEARSAWDFFDRNPRRSRPPVPTRLSVVVVGLRNDNGKVPLALYRGADGFGKPEKNYAADTVSISGDRAVATFPNLPVGDYAILILHDENANGKMDTSFGYPQEGFGASTNPKPKFGPFSFDDARFHIAGESPERRIIIQAIYL